jgi:uncharacterized membrane protein
MTAHLPSHNAGKAASWAALDRPISGIWCVLGWLAATLLFVGLITAVGGASEDDGYQSAYSVWAISHGQIACAFLTGPAANGSGAAPAPEAYPPPIYPLVAGGLAALTQVGHSFPFPSRTALGKDCLTALPAMYNWGIRATALEPTLRLGFVSWLALLAGVVALLRACGRGRRLWEPLTVLLVACLPPVWSCIGNVFHPQDLIAMGLALGGIACVRRDRWALAGVLLAIAVLSQQFALLVAIPLFVIAPGHRRMRFALAGIGTSAVVVLPIVASTSRAVARAVVLGTGDSPGFGGTVLWELHLHGGALVLVSRILPIAVSAVLAYWCRQRFGSPSLLEPVPLVALVALCLSLRLVFEQNIQHGYYFMALSVALVLLEVMSGRLRGSLVAWIVLMTLVFDNGATNWFYDESWRGVGQKTLPIVVILVCGLLILRDVRRRGISRHLLIPCALIVGAIVSDPVLPQLPRWIWQVILLSSGIALAIGPLLAWLTRQTNPSLAVTGATE